MRTIPVEEMKDVLEKHKKWLNDEGGEKADLSNTYLQNVNLRYVDLRYANLSGADLSHVYLQKANLQFAILTGADLTGADLTSADLIHTDLQFANLQNSFLQEAILYGAKLQNVQRPWLVYAGNIGSRRYETLYFADYDSVRCGCWNDYKGGTLTEFKARIDKVYPTDSKNEEYQRYRIEYLSAIKMFESMREAYLKSLGERQ